MSRFANRTGTVRDWRVGLALLVAGLAPVPASALTRAELATVEAVPAQGATVPAELVFSDGSGAAKPLRAWLGERPAVLILADYRCTQLCGPVLAIAARALTDSGLVPNRDFDLVTIGFNPDAGSTDAAAMRAAQLAANPELEQTALLLSGSPGNVRQLESALGYTAVRDDEARRYAHPATVFVLTAGGAVSRTLEGLSLDGETLRLALVEAGQGRIGSLVDRIHVLCYGLDPATGRYTGGIQAALRAAAVLMLAGFGGAGIYAFRAGGGRRAG